MSRRVPDGLTLDINCLLQKVPTMNEWGMMILMLLAGIAATFYMIRKKKFSA